MFQIRFYGQEAAFKVETEMQASWGHAGGRVESSGWGDEREYKLSAGQQQVELNVGNKLLVTGIYDGSKHWRVAVGYAPHVDTVPLNWRCTLLPHPRTSACCLELRTPGIVSVEELRFNEK